MAGTFTAREQQLTIIAWGYFETEPKGSWSSSRTMTWRSRCSVYEYSEIYHEHLSLYGGADSLAGRTSASPAATRRSVFSILEETEKEDDEEPP
ncbi:uncharacterized protein PG986_010519 [Apiospora aurea]|uniref:Uncharacterized protein n=1 Tax=Apiospora aurea TaxID=335848 RepID=A0ABR1Q2G6_9PEZI